jgi:hypothetical protein
MAAVASGKGGAKTHTMHKTSPGFYIRFKVDQRSEEIMIIMWAAWQDEYPPNLPTLQPSSFLGMT